MKYKKMKKKIEFFLGMLDNTSCSYEWELISLFQFYIYLNFDWCIMMKKCDLWTYSNHFWNI